MNVKEWTLLFWSILRNHIAIRTGISIGHRALGRTYEHYVAKWPWQLYWIDWFLMTYFYTHRSGPLSVFIRETSSFSRLQLIHRFTFSQLADIDTSEWSNLNRMSLSHSTPQASRNFGQNQNTLHELITELIKKIKWHSSAKETIKWLPVSYSYNYWLTLFRATSSCSPGN